MMYPLMDSQSNGCKWLSLKNPPKRTQRQERRNLFYALLLHISPPTNHCSHLQFPFLPLLFQSATSMRVFTSFQALQSTYMDPKHPVVVFR